MDERSDSPPSERGRGRDHKSHKHKKHDKHKHKRSSSRKHDGTKHRSRNRHDGDSTSDEESYNDDKDDKIRKTSKRKSKRKERSHQSSRRSRSRSRSRSHSSASSSSSVDRRHRSKRNSKNKKRKHHRDQRKTNSNSGNVDDGTAGSIEWAVSCVVDFLTEKPIDIAATVSLIANLADGKMVGAQDIVNQGLKVLLKQLVLCTGCVPANDGSRAMHAPIASVRSALDGVHKTLLSTFPHAASQKSLSATILANAPAPTPVLPQRRGVSGPQVPTDTRNVVRNDEDDDDDSDNGPQALGAPGQREASARAVAMSMKERKKIRAMRREESGAAKEEEEEDGNAREAWMMVPPDAKKNEMRLEMTSRGFEGIKRVVKDPKGARKAWTSTPGDGDGADDRETEATVDQGPEAPGIMHANEAVRMKLEAFNKEHRGESLMAVHGRVAAKHKKKKDEKKAAEAAAAAARGGGRGPAASGFSWDRDRDMAVGAVDKDYANKIMNGKDREDGLSSRFARGNFQ